MRTPLASCLLLLSSCAAFTPQPTTVYELAEQKEASSPLKPSHAEALLTLSFPRHSYHLSTQQKEELLAKAATWDKSKPLSIIGSCSAEDPPEFARVLGQRRAESARIHLVQNGWSSSKIHSNSVGNDFSGRDMGDRVSLYPSK
jgi:outer membrane protein OmpA-like peptidoglycan-associated protein